jgi:hypothetical protein
MPVQTSLQLKRVGSSMQLNGIGRRLAALLGLFCLAAGAHADNLVLTWTTPTQNTDNSPLTNLYGYFIYVGDSPDSMTMYYFVDAAATSVTMPYPPGNTNQYVGMTAMSTQWYESAMSPILVISPDSPP